MRQRLLTRPRSVASRVRLVGRRVPSIAEVPQVMARAGWLDMAARPVSSQAISKRLEVLPAALVGQLCADVSARLHAPAALPHPSWEAVRQPCPRRALGDGFTLDARRKNTQGLRERLGVVRGGKMLVRVAAFSPKPWWPW
jgi:hypothetical protein